MPPYVHPEMAIAALQRNIHALVEKLAGVYTKQVSELNAVAANKPELTFAMMFNQRMNPLCQSIKKIIDAGQIGDIRHISRIITTWWRPQGYYDQSAWRAAWGGEGGGILVNQAPHQLDLWQWICGMPQSVYAKVAFGFRRNISVEDEVTAVVDYGGGATGALSQQLMISSERTGSRFWATTTPRRCSSPNRGGRPPARSRTGELRGEHP